MLRALWRLPRTARGWLQRRRHGVQPAAA